MHALSLSFSFERQLASHTHVYTHTHAHVRTLLELIVVLAAVLRTVVLLTVVLIDGDGAQRLVQLPLVDAVDDSTGRGEIRILYTIYARIYICMRV